MITPAPRPSFGICKGQEKAPKADGTMGVLIGMSSLLVSTFLLSREGEFARTASFPAKLRATKLIIASELGVTPSQVTYLDQPEFHLDTFLTPGENGQVFTLRTLRAELKSAIGELRAAGYRVIGIPGEFNHSPVEDTNFMNGIVATGSNGKKFDIVGMSPTTTLNEAFRKVMAGYGITVFFVPDTQGLIRQRGIIHCVTNEEVETTPPATQAATAGGGFGSHLAGSQL